MNQLAQYVNVRETFQILVRRFGVLQKDGAQCCGISVVQSHILYELQKRPNISLNELADLLSIDTSTLSRQVHQLVEMELVNRLPDPNDRRYVVLSLTPKGVEQHKEIATYMETYFANLFTHIPKEKHAQVLESLQMINEAMRQSADCCTPPL
ncbi:MarR family transcriptional regulator [Brevibacillus composti]|uniref:MarR family transcriptional regulator n=1 Tax=Brevibacillus composti TaxID=2796470 RepID=A0A7T5JNI8_9BACL|nr:MarR family transcriptional regulator [Brevibacillus composti]QQE74161.1 MarR family transcriptional regulator [Brevibacillus composti]QUO41244.1 MarR family transcriptional regulator [Brevibacillus composti]